MKRTVTVIIAVLGLSITILAQAAQQKPAAAPAAALPTVDQVLDKFVQAIGGKPAFLKFNSRVGKGTFEIPAMGASGDIEIYAKAPNKSLLIINIAGFGTVQQAFNGTTGWAQEPQSGMRDMSAAEISAAKRDEAFHREIMLKELYTKLEVKAKEKVGEKDAYVVVATPAEGTPDKLYFDVQSGLLVRQDTERESPMGKVPIEAYLDDYKEVDGVKVPFTIRQTNPAFSFTIKLAEVKHNVPIDDAKFNKPAATQ
jgi:zinc protease